MCPSIKNSCDVILNTVRNSSLHFCLKETPHSIYLTIRKKTLDPPSPSTEETTLPSKPLQNDLATLKKKLQDSEELNSRLKIQCEEAVLDCEDMYVKNSALASQMEMEKLETKNKAAIKDDNVIQKLKEEKDNLENELEASERNWKALKKADKSKDKETYDLKKENSKLTENILLVKNELTTFKCATNKEKKDFEKKIKKLETVQSCLKSGFQCVKCDKEAESLDALKAHERINHAQTNSTQTEEIIMVDKKVQSSQPLVICDTNAKKDFPSDVAKEFKNYKCFYCERKIESEANLLDHKLKCHGISGTFCAKPLGTSNKEKSKISSPVFPPIGFPSSSQRFPYLNPAWNLLPKCVHCGMQYSCGTDLANHMKNIHKDYRSPFEVYKKHF